jgi:hypothetical protein
MSVEEITMKKWIITIVLILPIPTLWIISAYLNLGAVGYIGLPLLYIAIVVGVADVRKIIEYIELNY